MFLFPSPHAHSLASTRWLSPLPCRRPHQPGCVFCNVHLWKDGVVQVPILCGSTVFRSLCRGCNCLWHLLWWVLTRSPNIWRASEASYRSLNLVGSMRLSKNRKRCDNEAHVINRANLWSLLIKSVNRLFNLKMFICVGLCLFVCFCLYIYLCTTCASDYHRSQKKVAESLELELQTTGRHHVGSGTQNSGPLWKSS